MHTRDDGSASNLILVADLLCLVHLGYEKAVEVEIVFKLSHDQFHQHLVAEGRVHMIFGNLLFSAMSNVPFLIRSTAYKSWK